MKYDIWEDFPQKPLPDVLKFIVDNRGKTVPTADSGRILIATNCVKNENLFPSYEKIRYLSDETYSNWFRAHPVPGDILFVCKGTPGRCCLVPDPIDFCIAQDMVALRADEKQIYNYFLLAVLRSRKLQSQISNTSVGDVIPHFKKSHFDTLMIPLPPMEIQREIGDIYYKFSYKQELNKRINKNLEQQAQAIFKAWFVDFEPFDGEMPADWIVSKLGDIASIKTNSFSPVKNPDAQLEHYSIPAYDEQKYPVFESAAGVKSNKYILSKNSVMISKLNPDTKRVWRPMCLSELAVSSTEFIIFEAFNPAYRDFVFSIIDSATFSDWMCAHTTGSTNSRQRTTPSATLEFQVALPDEKTITDFCAIVTPMYDTISANICENQKLAQLRDSILPRLMSGELDVSDLDI